MAAVVALGVLGLPATSYAASSSPAPSAPGVTHSIPLVRTYPDRPVTGLIVRTRDGKTPTAGVRAALTRLERRSLGLRYFALGIPCPFLEAESCSIYTERPLVCREFLVSSPPENCAAPTAETVQVIPVEPKVSTALAALGAAPGTPAPAAPASHQTSRLV